MQVSAIRPNYFNLSVNRKNNKNSRNVIKPLPCDTVSFTGSSTKCAIILVGPPNSGKSTLAKNLSSWFKQVLKIELPIISSSGLIRINGSQKQLNQMSNGEMIDDEVMSGMVQKRIGEEDCNSGFILDGYPRNKQQADMFPKMLPANPKLDTKVIHFNVPDEVLLQRAIERWTCTKCGKTHYASDPSFDSKCTNCRAPLGKRPDDTKEIFEGRLKLYEQNIEPLLWSYSPTQIIEIYDNMPFTISRIFAELGWRDSMPTPFVNPNFTKN